MKAMALSKNIESLQTRLIEIGLTLPEKHCFSRTYANPKHGDWSWSIFAISTKSGRQYIVGSASPLREIVKKNAKLTFNWECKSGYINVEDSSHLKGDIPRTKNLLKKEL